MVSNRATRVAGRMFERIRRAFAEFLTIPLAVVSVFLLIALLAHWADVDAGRTDNWGPIWRFFGRYAGDPASATSLLSAIASGLITVTSITFSILLLAVQQGAAALTSQIIDQYLRRSSNQLYFGFFVGASIYTLVTLVLTTSTLRPVMGAILATLFAAGALLGLVLLIYSTIDQIRPVTIISKMHDVTIETRDVQLKWLGRTAPADGPSIGHSVVSDTNGYLARVRLTMLEHIARDRSNCAIEIVPSVGDYVPCGGTLATVTGAAPDEALMRAVRRALPVEEQRDIGCDAAFGIDQLVTIAWTSISTAKSNPASAVIACHALQDILFRWCGDSGAAQHAGATPIRYRDRVAEQLFDGFESLLVVASESMQHQSAAIVMDAMSDAFPRMPFEWKDRVERILLNSVTALGDHVPTRPLDASYAAAIAALEADGRAEAARQIATAWSAIAATRGSLHSRGNRG